MHQQHLRITFTTITRLRSFGRFADLDNNDITRKGVFSHYDVDFTQYDMHLRNDVTLKLIETRINFAIIELTRTVTNRLEQQWFGVEFRVNA